MAVRGPRNYQPQAGVGTDTAGGPLIDPTKNVLDLVRAESKYQDAMRDSEAARIRELSAAESLRIDQLAELRMRYDTRIADMLRESVSSTSSLVSSQLLQIQSTFDARVTRLEEFRLLSTGRSSVADPALAKSMTSMGASIDALSSSGHGAAERKLGRGEILAYITTGILVLSQIAVVAAFLLSRTH